MAVQKKSALDQVIDLMKKPNSTPIELAEAIWAAEEVEPGSFKVLAESGYRSRRMVYDLFNIWDRFRSAGVSKTDLAEVGWTKLTLLTRYLQPGDEAQFILLAKRMTVTKLTASLQKGTPTGTHPAQKTHKVNLEFNDSQYKTLVEMLLKCGASRAKNGKGLKNKEAALITALTMLNEFRSPLQDAAE